MIWDALLWAADQAGAALHRDMVVAVNGYSFGGKIPAGELHAAARSRGGALVRFHPGGGKVKVD